MAGGHIQINDLTKEYGGGVFAVDHINLEIASGEFFSMLGPSGCGKTTTLRMIAGFEEPTSGQILLDGVDMKHTPPHKRHVNTVFQAYMIFPHLNVFENVAFGLRRQRRPKAEVKRRVEEALELVHLTQLAARKPSQLSGGQQQRVALARALVLNPAVLLLDEPLGALDARLRRQLQIDLKALQQTVGITFVYVTHDQEEALTMSDRIAVMNHGHTEQVATPREMYEQPATEFVADFLGVSNLLDVEALDGGSQGAVLRIGDFTLQAREGATELRGAVRCVVRPERVRLKPFDSADSNTLPGIVERVVYLGSSTQVIVRLATGETVQAAKQNDGEATEYTQGTPIRVQLPADAIRVLARAAPGPAAQSENVAEDRVEARDEDVVFSEPATEGSSE